MLDRKKVLNWWTGRLSDQELAEWTGLKPRAVGIILGLPGIVAFVGARGPGSRHVRRIAPIARNAVATVAALSETGMTFELAANIIAAAPFLASTVTEVVDFSPRDSASISLRVADPGGGWLTGDIVPDHIWGRYLLPCRRIQDINPSPGNIFYVYPEMFVPNTPQGTMKIDRSFMRKPDIEVVPLTESPVYQGEIDPAGLYLPDLSNSVSLPQYDDHILIVNGKWVFHKQPKPRPIDRLIERNVAISEGNPTEKYESSTQKFGVFLVSVIDSDKKTARVIDSASDKNEIAQAEYSLRNFDSLLDVNMTAAVRRMKRRAYGLPVDPAIAQPDTS